MKELLPKISFNILMLLVASIPTFRSLSPILIVLFAVVSIAHGVVNKAFEINNKKVFFAGIAFFLIHLLSVIYSEQKGVAWFDIEVKLSLIVFPILFSIRNEYIIKNSKYIFISFSAVTIIANIYLLSTSFYNTEIVDIWHMNRDETWNFSSSNLSQYIHPSYLSMYNLFALVYLVKTILEERNKTRFLLIIPSLFLVLEIFLLQSKAGFMALAAVLMYITFLLYLKIKNKLLKLALPIIILAVSAYAISQNYRMQIMFKSLVEIVKTGDSKSSSTGARFEIWKATLNVVGRNTLLGVGAGDIKPEMYKEYDKIKTNSEEVEENHYNVHNQFLETMLGQGLIGFGLLIFLLFAALYQALKNKDHLLAMFILIIILNFFPESMLNQQAGVVFFAFFYYLMTLTLYKKNGIRQNEV